MLLEKYWPEKKLITVQALQANLHIRLLKYFIDFVMHRLYW